MTSGRGNNSDTTKTTGTSITSMTHKRQATRVRPTRTSYCCASELLLIRPSITPHSAQRGWQARKKNTHTHARNSTQKARDTCSRSLVAQFSLEGVIAGRSATSMTATSSTTATCGSTSKNIVTYNTTTSTNDTYNSTTSTTAISVTSAKSTAVRPAKRKPAATLQRTTQQAARLRPKHNDQHNANDRQTATCANTISTTPA